MASFPLRGRLVTLRPIRKDDLPLVHRWLNDPEVMEYWDGRDHPATFDRVEARFRKSIEGVDRDAVRFTIEAPARDGTNEIRRIGLVQHGRIQQRARNAQIDLLIGDPEYRDAGYGTDAMRTIVGHLFDEQRLHRVWLTLRATNTKAVRGAERCGFVREGVLRQHDHLEGSLVDVVVYGMLSAEWNALRDAPPTDDPE